MPRAKKATATRKRKPPVRSKKQVGTPTNTQILPEGQKDSGIRSKDIDGDAKNEKRKEIEGINNLNFYLEYNNKMERSEWISRGDKDEEFYFGKQFDSDEVKILNDRGQMAVPINRIRPLIRHFVSLCTANNPSFSVTSVNSDDNARSWIFQSIISKILADNFIIRHSTRAIYDLARRGLGHLVVDYDPHARNGKGEVAIVYATNREVVWDNTCSNWDFSDSENAIYTKVISADRAIAMAPEFEKEIMDSRGKWTEDHQARIEYSETEKGAESRIGVDHSQTQSGVSFVRFIVRYSKRLIPVWIITMGDGKQREYYTEKRLNAFIQKSKLKEGEYSVTKLRLTRVVKFESILDTLIETKILPIQEYPIIPFIGEDTQNAFPVSEVKYLRPMQDVINKGVGITIFNAQLTSNPRIYINKGAITEDQKVQIQDKIAQPGAIIDEIADPVNNVKEIGGHPLNPAFLQIVEKLQYEMEYQMSIFPSDLGDATGAHRTFKGIMAIHEFGKRNIALVIKSINDSFTRLGKVVLQFIQAEYKVEDVIRLSTSNMSDIQLETALQAPGVTQDNNSDLLVKINTFVKESGQINRYLNDLSVGEYDIEVVPNSFMYTDRQAKLQQMVELKQYNIVDSEAVLDETDVKNREDIKKRISLTEQLKNAVEQSTEAIEQKDKELNLMKKELERTDRKLVKAEMKAPYDKILNDIKLQMEEINLVTKSLTKGTNKETPKTTKSGGK